jgi:hypothetical protein
VPICHGTSACLSALATAGRCDELIELVLNDVLWSYQRWAVKAMAAQGRGAEAIAYAERCHSPWASDTDIDGLCEQILLASGHPEEASAPLRDLGESRRNVSWVVSSGCEEVLGQAARRRAGGPRSSHAR